MSKWVFAALLIALWSGSTVSGRSITFDDLYGMPTARSPMISPDGKQIAFILTTTDMRSDKSDRQLWLMNADGSNQRQLTFGDESVGHPRWSIDGSALLFLANRDSLTQIWSLPIGVGEARPVTDMSTGVGEFECLPNGRGVIFVTTTYPECVTDSCNMRRADEVENNPIKAKIYDKLLYRHYNHWTDSQVARLFIFDFNSGEYSPVHMSDNDVPTTLLGGYRDYDVSPESDEVAFAINVDTATAVSVNNDIFVTPISNDQPRRIIDSPGLDGSPRYSPDGRWLSYHSMARVGYESDQRDLVLYDRENGNHVNLTEEFDRSVGGYVWGAKSLYIYLSAIDHGLNKVYRVKLASGEVETLLDDAVYSDLQVSPDGKFLVVRRSLSNEPYELYRYDIKKRRLTRLTFFTEPIVDDLRMNLAESFWFEGTAGDSVHGFLTLPPDFDPDARYPLVLLIHGGPQWCWLGDFNYYGWNTQLMAAQGYVVAQIDPRGSVGYGIKFKEYVSGNWGRGEYDDLMTGVDYLIASRPFIDSTRMAALGRSYGGFMVNWIEGHTDRFECLIGVDGSSNQVSAYGSTEELWFPEWEFNGTLYDNPDEYMRTSAIMYAKNFKTPMLLVHGQKDFRVDLSEGLQMFTALQRMGVPSQLIYFPDEGHGIRKVKNHRYVYEKQFEWLARWLK